MLLKFRVGNFLSFDEEQSISMVAGSTDSHPDHKVKSADVDVLRASVIYGANASGKSNLVKAFLYSRNIVTDEPCDEEFKGRISNCLSFAVRQDEPSSFEYIFTSGEKIYIYGLEVQTPSGYVVNEWAYELDGNNNKEFFNTEEIKKDETQNPPISDLYRKYLSSADGHKLFLRHLMAAEKVPEYIRTAATEIYSWFKYSLIVRTNDSVDRGSVVPRDFLEKFETSLRYLDTGITGLLTDKLPKKTETVKRCGNISQDFGVHCILISDGEIIHTFPAGNEFDAEKVSLRHGPEFINSYDNESRGTQKLAELFVLLNSVCILNKTGKLSRDTFFTVRDLTLIADEIECGLHPNVSRELMVLYFQKGRRDMQFVFTTHETRLLEPELVRSDEIWFVDNDFANTKKSKLISLAQFKLNSKYRYRKAYLMGRFGAVPAINSVIGDENDAD